jgi:general secretion pathway protein H
MTGKEDRKKPCASAGSPSGFTLVEMLVVLVIVSLMLALVGTSISRNVSSAEMRTAAKKVAASLRYTRTKAILSKSEQVFLVDTENRTFQAAEREAQKLPDGMNVELNTARSELTSESVGGIRFFPDGGSTGGNVRLDANGRIYRVNVAWLTGEATLQRPDELLIRAGSRRRRATGDSPCSNCCWRSWYSRSVSPPFWKSCPVP